MIQNTGGFGQYKHEDIGSGLHVFLYDIDENYCLLIGGGDTQSGFLTENQYPSIKR